MKTELYLIAAVAVVALVTLLTRALPFLLFGNRPLPDTVRYLGRVLPPAIMVILMLHTAAGSAAQHAGWPWQEAVALALTALIQWFSKSPLVSIAIGAAAYVSLVNFL